MVSRNLLSLDYPIVLLMVSSFSNPAGLIQYAGEQGYSVVDFLIRPLRFGRYSSQPEVKSGIIELHQENKAFFLRTLLSIGGCGISKTKSCR